MLTKKQLVKNTLLHQASPHTPYCINLTTEAYKKYGQALLEKYASPEILEALKLNFLTYEEAISLSLGNYVLCISPPWWHWSNLPDSYKEFDPPTALPDFIQSGDYDHFFKRLAYINEHFDCYILITIWGSHFEKAYFARGIENFLGDLAINQSFAKQLLDFIIAKNLELLPAIAASPEIDGILLGSDWGSQLSLLMSPAIWRELIAPGELQEYELIHAHQKDVWIHSCGNIELILPDLVAMHVDALNPIQPECMDIYKLKDTYGDKLTFWGGISTQQTLPYGTPQEVIDETTQVIEYMSQNGGFITAPSQEIQTDVPLENLIALIETAKRFSFS